MRDHPIIVQKYGGGCLETPVDDLARRLEQLSRDAEGWIKLIRSRVVLGETDRAEQALSRGIEVFSDDSAQRDRIIAAALSWGWTNSGLAVPMLILGEPSRRANKSDGVLWVGTRLISTTASAHPAPVQCGA